MLVLVYHFMSECVQEAALSKAALVDVQPRHIRVRPVAAVYGKVYLWTRPVSKVNSLQVPTKEQTVKPVVPVAQEIVAQGDGLVSTALQVKAHYGGAAFCRYLWHSLSPSVDAH